MSQAPVSREPSSPPGAVIVPPVGDRGAENRLPVFNAVESSWFGTSSKTTSKTSDNPPSAGNRWSSPADAGWQAARAADSPSSAGSTETGLPRRTPTANLIPGTIPGPQPAPLPSRSPSAARERLAALQHGTDEGRTAARHAASGGEDEDTRPGSPS